MIYLLYGTEDYLIEKEIKKLKADLNIDEIDTNTYSMNETKIEDIVDDFQTYSLFSDSKTVIIEDSYIFSSKKCSIDQNSEILEKYLESPNPNTISIFTLNCQKLDERKKLVKLARKNGTVKELNNININILVKEMFENYEISNSLVNLLISRVGTNLEILNQEVNKIKIYKDKDLIITEDDIINLTSKNIESDMFALINYIVNKDKYNALLVYHELIKNNEEPVVMLINLSNKLRMIYQVKIFMKKGYSEADIAKILDVKPGALYYMRDSLRKYDEKRLIFLLEKLKELDYKIKTNSIDRFLGFELFILEN